MLNQQSSGAPDEVDRSAVPHTEFFKFKSVASNYYLHIPFTKRHWDDRESNPVTLYKVLLNTRLFNGLATWNLAINTKTQLNLQMIS